MAKDMPCARQMIRRKLHNKVRWLALEERMLEKKPRHYPERDAGDVNEEDELPRILWKERHREEHPHGQLRPAAHEWSHEYREKSIALGVKRARGHDRRDAAAEPYEHRNKTLAGKSYPAHEAIHHKCRTRHIA